jgi:ATP-dependent DNA helicase RecG
MKLQDIVVKNEGKTLEFKENTKSLTSIIKTIIAFANTAGGTIVIGIEDKTKKIVGLANPLQEEERLTSAIADSIAPLIVPDIEMQTYRDKEIILLHIPHIVGPYYLKDVGLEKGTYVRFGSTNRIVDATMLESLKLFAKNISFDQLPYLHEKSELDWDFINKTFSKIGKSVNEHKADLLELTTKHSGKKFPSIGGIILFGTNRTQLFPDAMIRCARFLGTDRANILDSIDIESYPTLALEEALRFIERNTSVKSEIGRIYRTDIPEYPPIALREILINALLHADYALKGSTITIAIFDDRIEITNPGGLVFGQTLQRALSGSSIIRNSVIAHTFRELKLIERWGSGLQRIIDACAQRGLEQPKFEERATEFRVTLYNAKSSKPLLNSYQEKLVAYLRRKERISTKEAAQLWKISSRNALVRLKHLTDIGIIKKIGTSARDPRSGYILVD